MIRRAKVEDHKILMEMFQKFYASNAVAHPIPQQYHVNTLHELFSYLSLQRCYIIEDETKKPVGYALLSLKYSHEAGGAEWWVEELYLKKSCRGKGYGTQFLEFILQEAEKEDIQRIRLEVEPENDKAAALYHKLGFEHLAYNQMVWEKDVDV